MSEPIFLITGANGFIGKHVLKEVAFKLLHKTISISSKQEISFFNFEQTHDIKSYKDLDELIFGRQIILIHCATKFQKTNEMYSWTDLLSANVRFPISIITYLSKISDLFLINLNSYWQAVNGKIGHTNSLYAKSKIEFINELRSLENYSKIKHVDLYLFDTYGPEDNREKLIPYMFDCFKHNKNIELSDVGQVLNFLHINDVVAGLLGSIKSSNSGKVLELSSVHNYSLKDVYNIFCEVTGKNLECNWTSQQPIVFMKSKWMIAEKPYFWQETKNLKLGISEIWMQSLLIK